MKLIIDIPKEIYEASQILDVKYEDTVYIPLEVIKNGIPLPEHHGRLIDADKLAESILCKTFGLRSVDIENAPTLIEANSKEKSEKK